MGAMEDVGIAPISGTATGPGGEGRKIWGSAANGRSASGNAIEQLPLRRLSLDS